MATFAINLLNGEQYLFNGDFGGTTGGTIIITASNGLTKTVDNITLGGILTGDTTISGNYTLRLTGDTKISTNSGYQISGVTILKTGVAVSNIFIGELAGSNGSGLNNIALGNYTLSVNTTGSHNTAIGQCVLLSNTTGSTNIALGSCALYINSIGSGNIALGSCALFNNNGNTTTTINISSFTDAGYDISDIVQFRIIRDSANGLGLSYGVDPYGGVASVLSFDVHVEIDGFGSDTQYSK